MEEKLTRREVREGAFIILYQTLFGQTPQEITEADEEAFGLARNHETDAIVRGVLAHDEEITGIISKYSTTRSVARISKVNLVIMKIAIYEIKYDDKVPGAAAINEAVELGKKYAYKQDCGFINGVLNSYLEEIENDRD
ncbi:MAG: transcription antitermination factor NusB [Oscillospiraceae bacterium]|nr:transcription antitermination factor NusB [Oscillospiraceae bacterium]